jgi:ABC-2 type transport system ATP-binding protein
MLIIDQGRVLLDSEVARFKSEHGTERTVVVDLDLSADPGPALDRPGPGPYADPEMNLTTGRVVARDGPRRWVRFDRRTHSAAEVIAEITAAHPVLDLTIEEPDIEELIRRIYASRPGGSE